MERVLVFLNYWIFGTLDTKGHRRRFSLREAWEIATIMTRSPKM